MTDSGEGPRTLEGGSATGDRPRGHSLKQLAMLHDAHCQHALGFAFALLRDRDAAEGCVEEALLRVWRAGLAGEGNVEAARLLLLSIVRRRVVELLQERRQSAREAGSGTTQPAG